MKSVQQDFPAADFLNSAFVNAGFVDATNKYYKTQARYNIRHDQIQIIFNDQILILYPHLIQVIQIGNI
ncbi:MAG: hypothetical protein ACI9XO_001197 [Paraglaciecola sp.]|jgi:hypothetical protein